MPGEARVNGGEGLVRVVSGGSSCTDRWRQPDQASESVGSALVRHHRSAEPRVHVREPARDRTQSACGTNRLQAASGCRAPFARLSAARRPEGEAPGSAPDSTGIDRRDGAAPRHRTATSRARCAGRPAADAGPEGAGLHRSALASAAGSNVVVVQDSPRSLRQRPDRRQRDRLPAAAAAAAHRGADRTAAGGSGRTASNSNA